MPPADPADPVADLRELLRATQEAAARLAAEPPRVPPQGWAVPPRAANERPFAEEVAALASLLAALRDLLPPEVQQQLADLVRQILLLVRALIDRWLEHLEPERGAEPEVEDIPIA